MAPDFQPATSVAYATGAGHFVGPFWLRTVGPNQVITLRQARSQAKSELKEVIEDAGEDLDEYQDLF